MSSLANRLDESIAYFFSGAGACTTRSQCDEWASNTFGGPVKPVPMRQGVYSYTVAAANGALIVQFRDPSSPLDTQMLQMVKDAHPGFVTGCNPHGRIGSSPGLLIYSMNLLPGDTYLSISIEISDDDLDHRLATVHSLAEFFAQSWLYGSSLEPDRIAVISADCHSSFDHLAANLDDRFQAAISRVRSGLPTLFSGEYPLVVTHGDLSEMNILADAVTGKITGIVDWAEASFQPFGFALYALDNVVGCLNTDGWVFHDNAEYLRDEFWRVFRSLVGEISTSEMESIQLARLAGLFLRYGIPHIAGHKGVVGIGSPNNGSIQFLDALILG